MSDTCLSSSEAWAFLRSSLASTRVTALESASLLAERPARGFIKDDEMSLVRSVIPCAEDGEAASFPDLLVREKLKSLFKGKLLLLKEGEGDSIRRAKHFPGIIVNAANV